MILDPRNEESGVRENTATVPFKCGVDIGGTFIDLVLLDEQTGRVTTDKFLSPPENPAIGVLQGITRLLRRHGLTEASVGSLIHATTLMTNALIERKGARTALITTRGFRDILGMRREMRYDMYDLFLEIPKPLVPRHLRKEVAERVLSNGQVHTDLDVAELCAVARELVDQRKVEAVAICFLHSYLNPAHETMARQILLAEYPHLAVSLSWEVAREIREYERTVTAVANAYVQPLAHRYLEHLETELADRGFRGSFYIMLSNGGLTTVKTAKRFPVRLLESGPAAGALVARYFGGLAGEENVMAFDMGGTTAKICLIDDGEPMTAFAFEAARVQRFKKGSGLPLKIPAIELIEIGAGGGSIASINELGLLTVGPESAGARPGPACYGRGGSSPTVTDADLLLGYLNPAYFLGGEMRLDVEAARTAVRQQVGEPAGLDELQAAWGIYEIANEHMAAAARIHVTEKGRDPRRYTLVATGGAGPIHAYRLARKLGIKKVVYPLGAGVASALGLLVTPPKVEFVHSYFTMLHALDWEKLNQIYAELEAQAVAVLHEAGVAAAEVRLSRTADMRYVGQGYEIPVPVPGGRLSGAHLDAMEQAFRERYRALYGRAPSDVRIEALNWRLAASGPNREARFSIDADTVPAGEPGDPHKGRRRAYFPELGGFVDVPVYDRYRLRSGTTFTGPAIVEEKESTVLVGPDAIFRVDTYQNLVVELI